MMKLLSLALLSGLSFHVAAQAPDDVEPEGGPPRWGIGLAAVLSDSPYAGEGTRVIPIPLVTYQGDRFFYRGITAGWRFTDSEAFEVSALAKLRMDGFDVKDLGRAELAANGLDRALLEDRDKGLDLGIGMQWRGTAGEIETELLADATDTSGGQEFSVQYGYPFEVGHGRITPNIGATWLSKDMADYYYGTLDEEVARGVTRYRPGSVTIPHVGVSYFQPLSEKWAMIAFAKYSRLPDEIQDSPFIERDTDASMTTFIGLARGF